MFTLLVGDRDWGLNSTQGELRSGLFGFRETLETAARLVGVENRDMGEREGNWGKGAEQVALSRKKWKKKKKRIAFACLCSHVLHLDRMSQSKYAEKKKRSKSE